MTVAGQRWAESNADRILGADLTRNREERSAGSVDERRWRRERARVLTTAAWEQWSASKDPASLTGEATAELFRVDRYVVGRARELKVTRLREMFAADQDLAPFLDHAGARLLEEK
jgi:hypothetical protein